ncbi:MAG TPA: serine/threonine-protein kinase [Blastocatellia bacterium]|nr:serine/threonine-protein kinase [Blastocatellia bacterium]
MYTTIQAQSDPPISPEIARDYRVVRSLGKGGMGHVYLAEQIRVGNRRVALKVLAPQFSSDPVYVKRFEKEAAAGRISHPNVVTVYDSRITSDGQIYIAMEFIEGRTLEDVMSEIGALPLSRIINILKQICAGLSAAHSLGIVHRDIKPANVMLASSEIGEIAKILDFGIARAIDTDPQGLKTKSGIIMGTPAYMSPEQAEGLTGDNIDQRSDIYSLGVIFYQMLTGKLAFESNSWMETLQMHRYHPPLPPSQRRSDLNIPPSVERIVMKALSKDRANRHLTVLEFAADLDSVSTDSNSRTLVDPGHAPEIPGTEPVAKTIVSPVAPKPHRPGIWIAAIFSVIALSAIIAGGIWLSMPATSPTIHSEEPKTASTPVLPVEYKPAKYRITLKKPNGQSETLDENNSVKSGQYIRFEFDPSQQIGVYLLYEDSDGSMKWINYKADGKSQTISAGGWSGFPTGDWIGIDKSAGDERFWFVFVPAEKNWSLSNVVSYRYNAKSGLADIGMDDSIKLRDYLSKQALRLTSSNRREDNMVIHSLFAKGLSDQISCHMVELRHS